MSRTLLLVLLGSILLLALYYVAPWKEGSFPTPPILSRNKPEKKTGVDAYATLLKGRARDLRAYARRRGFSTDHCFLVDMSLPSGKNRFFIYDLKRDSIIAAGLVAHGSCNTMFLRKAKFSNTPNCGCSSVGRYKVGYSYRGRFGKAYKLHGLDSTNSNAFKRAVVLHAYDCIPDRETYPLPACNSLGCPMVSYAFLDRAAQVIDRARKPILLWVY